MKKSKRSIMALISVMLTSCLLVILILRIPYSFEREIKMEQIPYEMSAQYFEKCLIRFNESIISDEANISEQIELRKNILLVYQGSDHDNAHKSLMKYVEILDYRFILRLFGQFFSSMTEDKLEITVCLLTRIIRETGWDGTYEMLRNIDAVCHKTDPYLGGHIYDTFAYEAGTPEEVILTIRRFLYSDDIHVVRASLAIINGWLRNDNFENRDFVEEIRSLGEKSNDPSIKKQVEEILESSKK